jgi:hypothetical protein
MLKCDALLNLIKLGPDPRIIFVTIGVKPSKCAQAFIRSVVIDEPLKQVLTLVIDGEYGGLTRGDSGKSIIKAPSRPNQ